MVLKFRSSIEIIHYTHRDHSIHKEKAKIHCQSNACTRSFDKGLTPTEGKKHRHLSNIDCLSFVVCPLLAPLIIGFFSFFFAAAIYSTNEANKAGSTCH
jgi:hypothetical protein